MKEKDLNYIAAVEKAIGKKYGDDAVAHPLKGWSDEKEKEYLAQIQEIQDFEDQTLPDTEYEELNGVLIHKKLIKERKGKYCSTCGTKVKTLDDDTCYTKYETCFKCYIKYIEGRKDRWEKGWRPKNVTSNTTNNSGNRSSSS